MLVNVAIEIAVCFCCSCVAAALWSQAAVLCVQICSGINSEFICCVIFLLAAVWHITYDAVDFFAVISYD